MAVGTDVPGRSGSPVSPFRIYCMFLYSAHKSYTQFVASVFTETITHLKPVTGKRINRLWKVIKYLGNSKKHLTVNLVDTLRFKKNNYFARRITGYGRFSANK